MLTLVACIGIPSTVGITLAVCRYTIKPKPFELFQMVHAMGRARLNGSLPIHFTIKSVVPPTSFAAVRNAIYFWQLFFPSQLLIEPEIFNVEL